MRKAVAGQCGQSFGFVIAGRRKYVTEMARCAFPPTTLRPRRGMPPGVPRRPHSCSIAVSAVVCSSAICTEPQRIHTPWKYVSCCRVLCLLCLRFLRGLWRVLEPCRFVPVCFEDDHCLLGERAKETGELGEMAVQVRAKMPLANQQLSSETV